MPVLNGWEPEDIAVTGPSAPHCRRIPSNRARVFVGGVLEQRG